MLIKLYKKIREFLKSKFPDLFGTFELDTRFETVIAIICLIMFGMYGIFSFLHFFYGFILFYV